MKWILKFTRPHRLYNGGETAGFPPDAARKILNMRPPVAVLHSKLAESKEDEAELKVEQAEVAKRQRNAQESKVDTPGKGSGSKTADVEGAAQATLEPAGSASGKL